MNLLLIIYSNFISQFFKITILKKVFIVTIFVVTVGLPVYAQNNPKWKLKYKTGIVWYNLTPTGILLINNRDGLHAIDPKSEKEIWNLSNFKDLPEGMVHNFKNTPFMEIIGFTPTSEAGGKGKPLFAGFKNPLKELKKDLDQIGKKDEIARSIIINPYDGSIVFDSKKTEFESIDQKDFLPEINCILLQGYYNKKQSFGLFDIGKQMMLWLKEKPVQLAKRFNFIDDELSPFVDADRNLLFQYVRNTYRMNSQTGEYIWKRPTDSLYKFVFTDNRDYCYATGGNFVAKVNLQNGIIEKEMMPEEFKNAVKDTSLLKSNIGLFLNGITIFPKEDALLISYGNGFNFLNYSDLTPLWKTKLTIKGFFIKNIRKTEQGNYLVFLREAKSNQDAITLVDSNGILLWQGPYMVKGSILNMFLPVSEGIIIITNNAGDLIDWKTGKSILSHPITYENNIMLLALAQENKSLAFVVGESIYEINYGKGKITEIIHKIDFKGKDPVDQIPDLFEVRKDGYFLSAPQNMMLISFDGNIKYKKYYPKPGLSDKARLRLARIGGLVAGYAFNNQAQQVTQALYGTGMMSTPNYLTLKTYDVGMSGTGSALLMSGLSGIAFARERERTEILQNGRGYQLVFTRLESGGTGFIKVDKNTGNELAAIRLDDKEPTILFDDAMSGMYYISDSEEDLLFYSLSDAN